MLLILKSSLRNLWLPAQIKKIDPTYLLGSFHASLNDIVVEAVEIRIQYLMPKVEYFTFARVLKKKRLCRKPRFEIQIGRASRKNPWPC